MSILEEGFKYLAESPANLDACINHLLDRTIETGLEIDSRLELLQIRREEDYRAKRELLKRWTFASKTKVTWFVQYILACRDKQQSSNVVDDSKLAVMETRLSDLNKQLADAHYRMDEYAHLNTKYKAENEALNDKIRELNFLAATQKERAENAERRIKELEQIIVEQKNPAPADTTPVNTKAIHRTFLSNLRWVFPCMLDAKTAVDLSTLRLDNYKSLARALMTTDLADQFEQAMIWINSDPAGARFVKNWIEKRIGMVLV